MNTTVPSSTRRNLFGLLIGSSVAVVAAAPLQSVSAEEPEDLVLDGGRP